MRTGRAHREGVRPVSRRLLALTRISVVLIALAFPSVAAAGARLAEVPTGPWLDPPGAGARMEADAGVRPRRLADVSWVGGTYTVAGAQVSVYVSSSYANAEVAAQTWARFFAGLPHGSELSVLRAYIAPLDEVQEACSSDGVVGCYGGERLISVGDSSAGIAPEAVAAHEYGHHVAANRINPPWVAVDWGTKRWASYEGVCARVAAKTAFPGDEGLNYSLNPGEAFAETFRVAVETGGTAANFTWPIVDASFRPDAQALALVREDTLNRWVAAAPTVIRGRFAKGRPTWSTTVATPLDGDLRVDVASAADLTLLSVDRHQILARGSWTGAGRKSATLRVCGARSLQVRLRRNGAAARFALRMTIP